MEFLQLDLFEDIAPRNEWEALVATNPKHLEDLIVGDRVKAKYGNGHEFEGVFCTSGFWDGRDSEQHTEFFIDIGGSYRTLSPWHEWVYIGHDDHYQKPRKDNLYELLVEELRGLPFSERLEQFKAFQSRYPYTSAEYWGATAEAWKQAIVDVTTLDEFLKKDRACPANFPKQVATYIREFVFNRPPETWLEELRKIRWAEMSSHDGSFVYKFRSLPGTYYEVLFLKFLTECKTAKELVSLMRGWGSDSKYEREKQVKQKVWIEDTAE